MLQIIRSPCAMYRYASLFQHKIYLFGHPEISTYIDGATPSVRQNYIQFCLENEEKSKQIHQMIPSTFMFEYYILWGHSRDIVVNTNHLNGLLCKKYKGIDYYY